MKLILEIESLGDEAAGRFAAGVVVLDAETSQPVLEAGFMLGPLPGLHAADYHGLLKAIGLALPLGPAEVEIRCGSEVLVNHITDAEPIADASLVPLYEQVAASLLRFDIWKIRAAQRQTHRAAAELARRALQANADVTQPPQPRAKAPPQATADPAATPASGPVDSTANPASSLPPRRRPWTVELLDEPGFECPARCHADTPHRFGPGTPAGFCIHAARAALNDGPLAWDDPDQRHITTLCPECEVPLRISIVE